METRQPTIATRLAAIAPIAKTDAGSSSSGWEASRDRTRLLAFRRIVASRQAVDWSIGQDRPALAIIGEHAENGAAC